MQSRYKINNIIRNNNIRTIKEDYSAQTKCIGDSKGQVKQAFLFSIAISKC